MRSSSSGTTTVRASRTIPTKHTRVTSSHFLRGVWGSGVDRRSVEASWRGKFHREKGAFSRTEAKKSGAGSSQLPPSRRVCAHQAVRESQWMRPETGEYTFTIKATISHNAKHSKETSSTNNIEAFLGYYIMHFLQLKVDFNTKSIQFIHKHCQRLLFFLKKRQENFCFSVELT